jgi:Family of unknown function (DUF5991)
MKTLILSAFLVLVSFGAANAQTIPSSWFGEYNGMESGMNATETRSFSAWAKLELSEAEGGITGIYTEGENSDTYNKYMFTAKGNATTISLYFGSCMPVEYGSSEPCTSTFKKGDLMFKLTKTKVKGKTTILTTWGKLNKGKSGKVYFVK